MGRGTRLDRRLLEAFVPINALSEGHLQTLLELHSVQHHAAGDVLFTAGQRDDRTLYLLSGRLWLEHDRQRQLLGAGDAASWHPLDPFQPRRTTVRAETDVTILCFDRARLDALLAWDQSVGNLLQDIDRNAAYEGERDWMARLLDSRLFQRVPAGHVFEIFRRLRPQRMKAGETAIRQGDEADCCYIVKDGLCEVQVQLPGASQALSVALLEPGQWFGEEALLTGAPRNATVRMSTDGVLMRLEREDFDALLKEPVVQQLTPQMAHAAVRDGAHWLDVRTPDEFEQQPLPGAMNLPLNVLRLKSRLLDPSRRYIAYCDTGRRSQSAVFLLQHAGLDVQWLAGGLQGCPELACLDG